MLLHHSLQLHADNERRQGPIQGSRKRPDETWECALSAFSLPSSISAKAAVTSCVKNARDTTIVFCTLFSNSHFVRGRSSYAGSAAWGEAGQSKVRQH